MNYLLDTNAVIALLKDRPTGVRGRLRRAVSRGASIAVSSIVLYELWYGVARSERRRENAERLRVFEVDEPGPQAWKARRLVELGYGPDEIRGALERVGPDDDRDGGVEELLRGALQELASR